MTRPRVCPLRPGFTLLELLVAMSLMVIIAAALYTSMYTAFRARESAEKAVLPLQRATTAINMLIEDVRGAVEPNTTLAGAFEGIDERDGRSRDTDRLTFYSSHHQVHGDDERITCGVGLISLTLIEAEHTDDYVLVREVTDNILTENPGDPVREVLCRHVRSLDLRYFDGTKWEEQWLSEDLLDALPLAVEVTLELAPPQNGASSHAGSGSRYDARYLDALTRLTQVARLPRGIPLEVIEAAAAEAESAAQGQAAGGPS